MRRFSGSLLVCLIIAVGASSHAQTTTSSATRTWSDASGRFNIEAKLVDHDDQNVRLLKADGKVVTVPLNVLSEDDQKHLKELKTEAENPFAGGVPMESESGSPPMQSPGVQSHTMQGKPSGSLEPNQQLLQSDASVTELPANGEEIFLKIDSELPSLQADPPMLDEIDFRQMSWPLGPMDAYVKISHPVCIEPSQGLFAASSNRVSNASSDAHFGRIHFFGPGSKRSKIAMELSETVRLEDHFIPADRTLITLGVGSNTERGGDLVLMSGLSKGDPQPLVRWHLPNHDKPGFKPKVEFARLVSATTAIVKVNDSVYHWDLAKGQCKWRIGRVRSGADIKISGGGKYLAVPDSRSVRIVDINAGELLGSIPFPSSLTPSVAFSPNGQLIALVAGNQYVVWDFIEAYVDSEMTIGTSAGKFYGWIGNDYLLTQLGGLVDPKLRLSLWSYGLPSGGESLTLPKGIVTVSKDHKMSLASAMTVPHPGALAAAKKLEGGDEKLMAVRPGTVVALKVDAPGEVDKGQMMEGLKKAVENVGWKVDDGASITVTAKIERGVKEEYHFRSLGVARLRTPTKTVSIKPYKASVRIAQGSTELWTVRTSKMVPYVVHLDRGQTIEAKMKEYEKPDPDYFRRLTLPSRILKADISKNVGRSRIKNGAWYDW